MVRAHQHSCDFRNEPGTTGVLFKSLKLTPPRKSCSRMSSGSMWVAKDYFFCQAVETAYDEQ
jgi:hypothetical protein